MKTKKPNPERIDEENPALTRAELRRARAAIEVLPEHIQVTVEINFRRFGAKYR
jgi:hypothetical protein